VVQVYVRDPVASVVRPVRQLRAFQRVELAPAESLVIEFEIPTDLLAFTGPDLERIVEPGEVVIEIGAASDDIRLAVPVTLSGAVQRVGAAARLRHRALVHRVATGTAPTSRRSVGPELGHVDLSDR
jgi:beta-glucosidase